MKPLKVDAKLFAKFMLCAPQYNIPDWFEPAMPPFPPRMDHPDRMFGVSSKHRNRKWYSMYCMPGMSGLATELKRSDYKRKKDYEVDKIKYDNFRDEVKSYISNYKANEKEIDKWMKEREKQRWWQWPGYWAANVLNNGQEYWEKIREIKL